MHWKTTAVLLLITVGVGAYVSLYELKQPTVEERQQQTKEIARLAPEEVSSLLVESPEAGKVSLQRLDGAWRLVSPLDARADDAQVRRILSELNPLSAERTLTTPKDKPFALADFGLEAPKASLSASAGSRTVKFLVGDKTPVGTNRYLKLADGPTIHVVTSSLFDAANQPVDAYRSHELVDADPASATQIALTSSKGACTLRKQGERWQLTQPITDDAESSTVSTMLGKLRGLRIERFVTNQPAAGQLAGWGFEAPSSRISITTDKPDQPLEVLVGTPTTEKPEELYVKRTDEPAVYAVKKDALEELFQDPQALRSHAVLDIAPGQVTKTRLTWQGSTWTIEKKDGQWRLSDGTSLDSTKTEDWLWKLRDLKLTRFIEDEPKDLGRYGLEPTTTEGSPEERGTGTIQVWIENQPDPKELAVGTTLDQDAPFGRRYGKMSGRSCIVELPEGINPIMTTTPESFRATPPSPDSKPPSGS